MHVSRNAPNGRHWPLSREPLIFFVHVPKTGGSAFNAYMKAFDSNGRAHCQVFINNGDKLREVANTARWLSGHVDYTTALARLSAATDRPIRFFACIREPTRQVMSNYNWLIEISRIGGQFYAAHPPAVKAASVRIRSSGSSDPDAVIENLFANPYIFLNNQSRFILGRHSRWRIEKIRQRLANYTLIDQNVEKVAERATGVGFEKLETKNKSQYHFDISLFQDFKIRKFLERENKIDEILFKLTQERAVSSSY